MTTPLLMEPIDALLACLDTHLPGWVDTLPADHADWATSCTLLLSALSQRRTNAIAQRGAKEEASCVSASA